MCIFSIFCASFCTKLFFFSVILFFIKGLLSIFSVGLWQTFRRYQFPGLSLNVVKCLGPSRLLKECEHLGNGMHGGTTKLFRDKLERDNLEEKFA